jgi:hypothetical protein
MARPYPGISRPVRLRQWSGQRTVLVRNNFFHQVLVHRSLSEGSRIGVSSPSPLAPRGCTVSASGMGGAATVVDALRHSGLLGPFQFPL